MSDVVIERKNRYPRAPRIIVKVDKETIKASKKRDSSHCMIAEAIKAQLPEAESISVDLQTIRFTDDARSLRYVYLTPRVAQRAIVLFDDGREPEPFEFTLKGAQVVPKNTRLRRETPDQKKKRQQREAKRRSSRVVVANGSKVIVDRHNATAGKTTNGSVPDTFGGKEPPMSKGAVDDGVPFSRKRAFGCRALVL